MVGVPGNYYNIHYPDGTVEGNVTLVGDRKDVGDVVVRPSGTWVVTEWHFPKEPGAAYELSVEPRPAND